MLSKSDMRVKERRRRAGLDAAYWRRIGQAMERQLAAPIDALPPSAVVACYAAFAGEPDVRDLPRPIAFPVVDGDVMRFAQCRRDELVPGRWGIMEPPPGSPTAEPDLVLVPGLAFSVTGQRLGRGKAFYDRYLSRRAVPTIGLVDRGGLYPELPVDPHDIPVLLVLTEEGAYGERALGGFPWR